MSGMTQDDAIKIVESIGDVLGLEKIKDRMGISYYAESENTVVRISDHSTYCQTWVDKGTYKKTNKYSVVIEVNPSKPNPIINIPVSEFSIKEFKHKLKKLDNNSVMNITNAIKGAIGPGGQFSNPEQVMPKTIISKYIPPKPSISKTNNKGTNKSKNMKKNTIKLNEAKLKKIVAESVKKVLMESQQENLYQTVCNLEEDLKTVIRNTDSTSNQAFGSPEEKLRAISNSLSHIDENLSEQAVSTFRKLLDVINELQEIRINLQTLGATDAYWGHSFKSPNGTVGLSNYH